jgi:uncharacterized protein (TIGR03435 family)
MLTARLDDERDLAYHRQTATPVSSAEMKQMMQRLLEGGFQLKLHRDTKVSPVGVLTAGKNGVKNLRASELQRRLETRREAGTLYMKNATMANVAGVTTSPRGNTPMEKLIDDTGLSGMI